MSELMPEADGAGTRTATAKSVSATSSVVIPIPMATGTPMAIACSDRMLGPYAHDFVVARTTGTTVLTGPVRDAAHLHGIVTHLTSLGLELVGVAELPVPSLEPSPEL